MATGWGRDTWGSGTFGTTSVAVSITNVAGTGAVGNESVRGDCNLTETGLAGLLVPHQQ